MQQGQTQCDEVVSTYQKQFNDLLEVLKLKSPTIQPKATQHIPEIIKLIERLLKAGVAYIHQGHVFFAVHRFASYGELSNRQLRQNIAGEGRDSIAKEQKQQVSDFVLWKPSKDGEPVWEAPFGSGRPGWHIECSAMAHTHLGETFDIHGGGQDLLFPHHENERAQTMAAFGCKQMANYWVHNAFVNLDAKKMSKSLGNIVKFSDLVKKHHPMIIKLALLMTHYRKPINFGDNLLQQAEAIWGKINQKLSFIQHLWGKSKSKPLVLPSSLSKTAKRLSDHLQQAEEIFKTAIVALYNDLNTPLAVSCLGHLIQTIGNLENIQSQDTSVVEGEWIEDGPILNSWYYYVYILADLLGLEGERVVEKQSDLAGLSITLKASDFSGVGFYHDTDVEAFVKKEFIPFCNQVFKPKVSYQNLTQCLNEQGVDKVFSQLLLRLDVLGQFQNIPLGDVELNQNLKSTLLTILKELKVDIRLLTLRWYFKQNRLFNLTDAIRDYIQAQVGRGSSDCSYKVEVVDTKEGVRLILRGV